MYKMTLHITDLSYKGRREFKLDKQTVDSIMEQASSKNCTDIHFHFKNARYSFNKRFIVSIEVQEESQKSDVNQLSNGVNGFIK